MEEFEVSLCQSCAMPLNDPAMLGTMQDGSASKDYCRFCFMQGNFTADLTIDQMIQKLIEIGQEKIGLSEHEARHMAETVLPGLKRWSK